MTSELVVYASFCGEDIFAPLANVFDFTDVRSSCERILKVTLDDLGRSRPNMQLDDLACFWYPGYAAFGNQFLRIVACDDALFEKLRKDTSALLTNIRKSTRMELGSLTVRDGKVTRAAQRR